MDISTLVSTLVGGICTLVGAFGAIYLTSWFDRKKEKQTKYVEKIEAIGAYMPQLYRWYREEAAMYWDEVQEEYTYDPRPNKYDCPYYEIENLVNWWIPSLRGHTQQIGEVVTLFENLRGYEGARVYSSNSGDPMLASDVQRCEKIFKENYDYIWNTIGAEAKKALP